MGDLRWILLAIGGAIVLGIYVFATVKKMRNREPVPSYDQVDWEQDNVQALSEPDDDFDDLPSMDALQAARLQSAVEGMSFAEPVVEVLVEDIVEEDSAGQVDIDSEEREEPEGHQPEAPEVSAHLREVWLKGKEMAEPAMGTPVSAIELAEVQADPLINAGGLETPDSMRHEPSIATAASLDIDGEAVAAALQRRRGQAQPQKASAPVPAPVEPKAEQVVQDAFRFDEEVEPPVATPQPDKPEPAKPAETVEQRVQRIKEQANKKLREDAELQVQQNKEALRKQQEQHIEQQAKREQASAQEEVVVLLHIKARDSIGFYGPEMEQCFADIGIKFGDLDIYHYHSGGQRLLSVANMVKPGTFDPDNMTGFTTPGISLFLQLHPESNFELCEQVLVMSAQYIAYKLKGDVLTEERKSFDNVQQAELSRRIADIKAGFEG